MLYIYTKWKERIQKSVPEICPFLDYLHYQNSELCWHQLFMWVHHQKDPLTGGQESISMYPMYVWMFICVYMFQPSSWKRRLLKPVAGLCVHTQSRPVLCSPMDHTRQAPLSMARMLKWVAVSFCRGSSWLRDQTHVPRISCTGRWILSLGSYGWGSRAFQCVSQRV